MLIRLVKGRAPIKGPVAFLTDKEDHHVFPVSVHDPRAQAALASPRHREIVQKVHDNTKDPEKKAKHAEYLKALGGGKGGAHGLVIKPNSEKSFRVTGNTATHEKALAGLVGKGGEPYGTKAKNGDWIFSNKRRELVEGLLARLGGAKDEPKAEPPARADKPKAETTKPIAQKPVPDVKQSAKPGEPALSKRIRDKGITDIVGEAVKLKEAIDKAHTRNDPVMALISKHEDAGKAWANLNRSVLHATSEADISAAHQRYRSDAQAILAHDAGAEGTHASLPSAAHVATLGEDPDRYTRTTNKTQSAQMTVVAFAARRVAKAGIAGNKASEIVKAYMRAEGGDLAGKMAGRFHSSEMSGSRPGDPAKPHVQRYAQESVDGSATLTKLLESKDAKRAAESAASQRAKAKEDIARRAAALDPGQIPDHLQPSGRKGEFGKLHKELADTVLQEQAVIRQLKYDTDPTRWDPDKDGVFPVRYSGKTQGYRVKLPGVGEIYGSHALRRDAVAQATSAPANYITSREIAAKEADAAAKFLHSGKMPHEVSRSDFVKAFDGGHVPRKFYEAMIEKYGVKGMHNRTDRVQHPHAPGDMMFAASSYNPGELHDMLTLHHGMAGGTVHPSVGRSGIHAFIDKKPHEMTRAEFHRAMGVSNSQDYVKGSADRAYDTAVGANQDKVTDPNVMKDSPHIFGAQTEAQLKALNAYHDALNSPVDHKNGGAEDLAAKRQAAYRAGVVGKASSHLDEIPSRPAAHYLQQANYHRGRAEYFGQKKDWKKQAAAWSQQMDAERDFQHRQRIEKYHQARFGTPLSTTEELTKGVTMSMALTKKGTTMRILLKGKPLALIKGDTPKKKPDGFITVGGGEEEGGHIIPVWGFHPHPEKPGKLVVESSSGHEFEIDKDKHEAVKRSVKKSQREAGGQTRMFRDKPPTKKAQESRAEKLKAEIESRGKAREKVSDGPVKAPHEITLKQHIAAKMQALHAKYPNAKPDTLRGTEKIHQERATNEWKEAVLNAARTHRLPNHVLRSWAEHYGEASIPNTFRGAYEKGAGGDGGSDAYIPTSVKKAHAEEKAARRQDASRGVASPKREEKPEPEGDAKADALAKSHARLDALNKRVAALPWANHDLYKHLPSKAAVDMHHRKQTADVVNEKMDAAEAHISKAESAAAKPASKETAADRGARELAERKATARAESLKVLEHKGLPDHWMRDNLRAHHAGATEQYPTHALHEKAAAAVAKAKSTKDPFDHGFATMDIAALEKANQERAHAYAKAIGRGDDSEYVQAYKDAGQKIVDAHRKDLGEAPPWESAAKTPKPTPKPSTPPDADTIIGHLMDNEGSVTQAKAALDKSHPGWREGGDKAFGGAHEQYLKHHAPPDVRMRHRAAQLREKVKAAEPEKKPTEEAKPSAPRGQAGSAGSEVVDAPPVMATEKPSRLDRLKASLEKKKANVEGALDSHFADVAAANGQPLNDKRNGAATMNRWERQSHAIRAAHEGVSKTERAIEREEGKIADVKHANSKLPKHVLDMVADGSISQWRRHPNTFFVPGVDKGRIVIDLETGAIGARYMNDIPKDQYPKFRDVVNAMLAKQRETKAAQERTEK